MAALAGAAAALVAAGVEGSAAGVEGTVAEEAATVVAEAAAVADTDGVESQAARVAGSNTEVHRAQQFRIEIAVVPVAGTFPANRSLPAASDPEISGPGRVFGWS